MLSIKIIGLWVASGGHLGHVTRTVSIHFYSHFSRFHVKNGLGRSFGLLLDKQRFSILRLCVVEIFESFTIFR